jgi:hypothetical protein
MASRSSRVLICGDGVGRTGAQASGMVYRFTSAHCLSAKTQRDVTQKPSIVMRTIGFAQ